MTGNDLIQSLARSGLFNPVLDDGLYDTMSEGFVSDAWAAWVASLPIELTQMRQIGGGKSQRVPKWTAEVWDCDNLARSFGEFIVRCFAVDAIKRGVTRGNPASGFLSFADSRTTRHAIIWFCDHEGIVKTFDPGTGGLRPLSVQEAASVYEVESL